MDFLDNWHYILRQFDNDFWENGVQFTFEGISRIKPVEGKPYYKVTAVYQADGFMRDITKIIKK